MIFPGENHINLNFMPKEAVPAQLSAEKQRLQTITRIISIRQKSKLKHPHLTHPRARAKNPLILQES